jgi:hypothetical protein
MNDAEFLRYLAQNDYMIDQHYLPDGERLLEIADSIDDDILIASLTC